MYKLVSKVLVISTLSNIIVIIISHLIEQPYTYTDNACFHRFAAGRRKLVPGSELSVHQVAAAPAEQMDPVIRRKWKRAVGVTLLAHTSVLRFTTEQWEIDAGRECAFEMVLMGYGDVSGSGEMDGRGQGIPMGWDVCRSREREQRFGSREKNEDEQRERLGRDRIQWCKLLLHSDFFFHLNWRDKQRMSNPIYHHLNMKYYQNVNFYIKQWKRYIKVWPHHKNESYFLSRFSLSLQSHADLQGGRR